MVNVPEDVNVCILYPPDVEIVPPVGSRTAVVVTTLLVAPSELVTLILTTLPLVTLLYTAEGTVTVAEVVEDGVTVTSSLIPSDT